MILKAVGDGEFHGLGIARRVEQLTHGTFTVGPGSLFPALHRMEEAGWLNSFWGESENNRRARYYRRTKEGEALAESGGLEQVKQAVRDQRASTVAESVVKDIRYGSRQMRHNPAFAWTAVITLGLGIGATNAIFSAVYALLISPLPYPDSDCLMEILDGNPKNGWLGGPLISPDFVGPTLFPCIIRNSRGFGRSIHFDQRTTSSIH